MAIDIDSALHVSPRPVPVRAPVGVMMRGYRAITPVEAPATMLDPLSGAGVQLTRAVLGIVSVALSLLLVIFAYQENAYREMSASAYRSVIETAQSPPGGASDAKSQVELLASMARNHDSARESWMKVAQLILLNLLLPVLTALLGYVFGSRQPNR